MADTSNAISIVEDKTVIGNDKMVLVIEIPKGHPPENLTSLSTRQWVLNEARSRGFPARGLGAVPQPYPVDAEGNTDGDLVLGKRDFVAWRADYQINAGI